MNLLMDSACRSAMRTPTPKALKKPPLEGVQFKSARQSVLSPFCSP
jgi:hypothetical protein